MNRRAFTLVEALVAVAVIALLIGVLVPTLSSARAASQGARCVAQIRQLGVANAAFAVDHRGRSVPAAAEFRDNLRRWHGERSSVSERFDPARGALTPYLGSGATSEGVRACPTFEPTLRALREDGRGFEAGAGGYGYNAAFVGADRTDRLPGRWTVRDDRVGARRDRFRRPAETVEFTDAAFASDDGLIEYSFVEPSVHPHAPTGRPDPSTHFRHRGYASVAWLDGHVSQRERDSTAWSGIYRTDPGPLNLGWFGPEDSNALFDYE